MATHESLPDISVHFESEWKYINSKENKPDLRFIKLFEILSVYGPLSKRHCDRTMCRVVQELQEPVIKHFCDCIMSNAREDCTLVHLFAMANRPYTLSAILHIFEHAKKHNIDALDILVDRLLKHETDLSMASETSTAILTTAILKHNSSSFVNFMCNHTCPQHKQMDMQDIYAAFCSLLSLAAAGLLAAFAHTKSF